MSRLRVIRLGASPEIADAVLILVHGRGATAESMVPLYEALDIGNMAGIAPEAPGGAWYPHSFLAPIAGNQPYLDQALHAVDSLVVELLEQGVPAERLALVGFSQGACLTAELVARFPRPYNAVMILTGGLIGPPGTPREYEGRLDGTLVFIGAGDPDPHVPFTRVEETADVLTRMGAEVDMRRYPGMPHTINDDEVNACRNLLRRIASVQGTGRPA